ncbi:hypothetical protein QUB63_19970 [Microcoleus sp. ARI1-B5]|uniref:hypothetical protein n=1 Tax=unclassified Microcoleus TaxID=2642155 RepID=UPI002FD09C2C
MNIFWAFLGFFLAVKQAFQQKSLKRVAAFVKYVQTIKKVGNASNGDRARLPNRYNLS